LLEVGDARVVVKPIAEERGIRREAGATAVVEGPAGIGKTALVSAAAQIAAASDLQVLRALGGWTGRAERDDLPGARQALGLADGIDPPLASCSFAYAVGRLRTLEGDLNEGLQALMACEQWIAQMRAPNPAANLPWRADAALLAMQLGDNDTARRLIDESLELATAFGAPHAIAVALRTAGLIEGGDRGLERLEAAVAMLEGCELRLHLARSLVEQGAAMRRAGRRRDALPTLRRGLDLRPIAVLSPCRGGHARSWWPRAPDRAASASGDPTRSPPASCELPGWRPTA
jgi:tetratricopeptide (TPR) repeat protein